MATRESPGALRRLGSGRWQARYRDPVSHQLIPAGVTFDTKQDAEKWLIRTYADLHRDKLGPGYKSPTKVTLKTYAGEWLAARDIKPRTRDEYDRLAAKLLYPDLGDIPTFPEHEN